MAIYSLDGKAVEIKAERVSPREQNGSVSVTFRVITGKFDQNLTVVLIPVAPNNRIEISPELDPNVFYVQTMINYSKLKALLGMLVGMTAA